MNSILHFVCVESNEFDPPFILCVESNEFDPPFILYVSLGIRDVL